MAIGIMYKALKKNKGPTIWKGGKRIAIDRAMKVPTLREDMEIKANSTYIFSLSHVSHVIYLLTQFAKSNSTRGNHARISFT